MKSILGLLAVLGLMTVVAEPLRAGPIGSTLVTRGIPDTSAGQMYIYEGGSFQNNEKITSFSFVSSYGGGNLITPVLFQHVIDGHGTGDDLFQVVGVGTGQIVSPGTGLHTFAFGLTSGTDVIPATGEYTFGFTNALVDGSGNAIATSTGLVDFAYPPNGPPGVGGPGSTNLWRFTGFTGGAGATGIGNSYGDTSQNPTFPLLPVVDVRTYSAQADATAVPEPGSLALLALGGLTLVGWRCRRKGRRPQPTA